MAEITSEQMEMERQIQTVLWNFRKRFYNPEASDEYWNALVEQEDALLKKYNSEYFAEMIIVCVADIEYRFKSMTHNPYLAKDPLKNTYDMIRRRRAHT